MPLWLWLSAGAGTPGHTGVGVSGLTHGDRLKAPISPGGGGVIAQFYTQLP